MPLAVTFEDSADGTGCTAHVTGTGGGSVAVRTSRVTGNEWPALVWADPVTRVGDGAVPLTLAAGSYFGYAAVGSTVTVPTAFGATDPDGGTAIATLCRDAAALRIAQAALPGCRAVLNDAAWLEWANKDFPAVVLTTEGLREFEATGLNELDLIGHPVRVSVIDRMELRDVTALRDKYEPWRERISNAFRWQKLPGVSTNYLQTTVEHLDIADRRNPEYQGFVSALILWCWVYRTRGL